jgi:hypothetical protein
VTPKGVLPFDSHALPKFFQKEPGQEQIVRLLELAHRARARKLLGAINLGEIISITTRAFGNQKKIEVLAHIDLLGSPC